MTTQRGVLSAPRGLTDTFLLDADWKDWFARVPKTYREHVWWTTLLVANRRVFLLHAVAFVSVFVVAERLEFPVGSTSAESTCPPPQSGCNIGWKWWWVAPSAALLGPAVSFIGRWYEADYLSSCFRSVARARNAFWQLAIAIGLAVTVYWVQARLPFCQYRCLLFRDWFETDDNEMAFNAQLTGLHVVCLSLLTLLAVLSTIRELFWPADTDPHALDDRLDFERRLRGLRHTEVAVRRRARPLLSEECIDTTTKACTVSIEALMPIALALIAFIVTTRWTNANMQQVIGASVAAALLGLILSFVISRCCWFHRTARVHSTLMAAVLPVALAVATYFLLVTWTAVSLLFAALAAIGAALLGLLFSLAIASCTGLYEVQRAVKEAARMYTFWITVWVIKVIVATVFEDGTGRTVIRSFHALSSYFYTAHSSATWIALALRLYLIAALWYLAAMVFIADTLGWYQLVIAVWGGVPRLARAWYRSCVFTCIKLFTCHDAYNLDVWTSFELKQLYDSIKEKLIDLPHLTRKQRGDAAQRYWECIVEELKTEHLIDHQTAQRLKDQEDLRIRSVEANRRLRNLVHSLKDDNLNTTRVFRAPGLTTLIPSYNEAILNDLPNEQSSKALRDATKDLRNVLREGVFGCWGSGVSALLLLVIGATFGAAVAATPLYIKRGSGDWQNLRRYYTFSVESVFAISVICLGAIFVVVGLRLRIWQQELVKVRRGAGSTPRGKNCSRAKSSLRACASRVWQKLKDKLQVGGVSFSNGKGDWNLQTQSGKFNFEDAELVQAAQLKLRQLLELLPKSSSSQRNANQGRRGLAAADAAIEMTTGGVSQSIKERNEHRNWLALKLYKPLANRSQPLR